MAELLSAPVGVTPSRRSCLGKATVLGVEGDCPEAVFGRGAGEPQPVGGARGALGVQGALGGRPGRGAEALGVPASRDCQVGGAGPGARRAAGRRGGPGAHSPMHSWMA